MDIPELQAQLDSVLNIKQKYEALKEEYYRISKEKEFQKVDASIYEVDDDIQKLEGEAKIVETADDTFHSFFKALEQRQVKLADPSFHIPKKIDVPRWVVRHSSPQHG
ncbi:hypothetical protein TNCV_4336531 [Trichonephila clavipes]|nr:hypothetical protein TNCV_4336531 [Trichonephila clavipes]